MARINVTGNIVLDSVVALLRAKLELDDSTCYVVDDADDVPDIPIAGDWWTTVAAGDGMFEEGNQDPSQCTEETEFIVTGYTRIATDRTDHAERMIQDPARGTMAIKRAILAALVGVDLETPTGDTFLRNQLYATRASRPSLWGKSGDESPIVARMQIVFRSSYDWNLS
jgi:hypothetical protein